MISGFKFQVSPFRLALCAMPLAWLWFVLINHLRIEWTYNAQYSYGWAVPLLCAFLIFRKIQHPSPSTQHPASRTQYPEPIFYLPLALCALLYAPTRLIQVANPDWRLVSWALALEVIGITLCILPLAFSAFRFSPSSIFHLPSSPADPVPPSATSSPPRSGRGTQGEVSNPHSAPAPSSGLQFPFSAFRFPLLFFLVSVPWPTVFEGPLIQLLTRLDVSAACDLAGCLGIPAIPHGNVIELGSGMVGVDEACSGIRSFQATLMISLFLGEFYQISVLRRLILCLTGFALAILLNLARQMVLIWVAAHKGVSAIAKWHDPTGVVILLGCFFALWSIGVWLAGKKPSISNQQLATCNQTPSPSSPPTAPVSAFRFPLSTFLFLSFWLLFVEIGVEGWYRVREARLPAPVTWNIAWPTNTVVKDLPLAPDTRRILRFDDGQNRQWQADGFLWQAIFLRWDPGSVAARLTANHTPEVCLTAAGHRVSGGEVLHYLAIKDLRLPFRFYQLGDTAQPVFVGYCLWEDRASRREFSTSLLGWGTRLAPVLAGQRNSGQRSLELVITGVSDFAAAQIAVKKLLEEIISVKH